MFILSAVALLENMQATSDSSRSEFLICDVAIEHQNFLTVCSESDGKLNRGLATSLINIAARVCVRAGVRCVHVHVCACVCEHVWEGEGFQITHCM